MTYQEFDNLKQPCGHHYSKMVQDHSCQNQFVSHEDMSSPTDAQYNLTILKEKAIGNSTGFVLIMVII